MVPARRRSQRQADLKSASRKASSEKVLKGGASTGSPAAKSKSSSVSKKASAAAAVKKTVVKTKAEDRRSKRAGTSASTAASSTGSSKSSQVTVQPERSGRRTQSRRHIPQPDFDYLANTVMFSVSEGRGMVEGSASDGEILHESDSAAKPLPSPESSPSKSALSRSRGRPRKTKTADLQETGTNFSVPVYVMIERGPGSTGKNASDNQGNWIGGPVTVDQNTTWEGFLEDIATAAEDSDPQDLVVKSLKWADPTEKGKTVQWLPMTNEAGFSAFVSNGILAARGTQTKFRVKMSPPVPRNKVRCSRVRV